MAKKKRDVGTPVDVNMTPMIDCTFQLIIFFILTAQMASEELAKVVVPKPYETIAITEEDEKALPNRVIVNIVNEYGDKDNKYDQSGKLTEQIRDWERAGRPKLYQLGQLKLKPYELEQLTTVLKQRRNDALKQKIKPSDFYLEIRSDKDIYYSEIEPVMRAAAEAEIQKMSITAIADKQKQKDLKANQ